MHNLKLNIRNLIGPQKGESNRTGRNILACFTARLSRLKWLAPDYCFY